MAEKISKEIEAVAKTFEISSKYGLEIEVFWQALRAFEKKETENIIDALEIGLAEWIK